MTSNYLKSRWIENHEASLALAKIKELIKHGRALTKDDTHFRVSEDGLSDFRGLDLSGLKIKNVKTENSDFSNCSFKDSWIEKSSFINVKFNRVDFTNISDKGNIFEKATFVNCKFNKAGIGYEGTRYLN